MRQSPTGFRPTDHRIPHLLAALEQELFALRRRPPDLAAAFRVAMIHAAGPDTTNHGSAGPDEALLAAGAAVIAAVERAAAASAELAYHNRHHIAEATLAMGWLAGTARRDGAISAEDAQLAVVAMTGHDLLHDGSPPGGGALEARSAEAVADAIRTLPLTARQRSVIRLVILGTNPDLVASNAARAAAEGPPGPLGRDIDLVVAMGNEADVFASLLPDLGAYLTRLLIAERPQTEGAPDLAGPGRRQSFLDLYARLTPAAVSLGLRPLLTSGG